MTAGADVWKWLAGILLSMLIFFLGKEAGEWDAAGKITDLRTQVIALQASTFDNRQIADSNKDTLDRVTAVLDKRSDTLDEMNLRLARIEERLGIEWSKRRK